jgi:translocation and assembly module TamA
MALLSSRITGSARRLYNSSQALASPNTAGGTFTFTGDSRRAQWLPGAALPHGLDCLRGALAGRGNVDLQRHFSAGAERDTGHTIAMRFKLLFGATLLSIASVARSADPQPYVVRIDSSGNGALNAALRASSQLDSLRTKAPVGPFALVDRAQQDIGRLQTVLNSFGYYRGSVTVTVNDQPLDEPGLPDLIQALPKSQPAKVEIHVDPGVLFHIRNVVIEGTVSAAALKAMNLPSGASAAASDVLAARDRLLTAIEDEGHAYARVDQPVAYLDGAEPVLDVHLQVDAGPRYVLGAVHIEGLKHVKAAFAERQLSPLHPGDPYTPSAIERVRTTLLGLGVFAVVTVRLPPQREVQGDRVPITFVVSEQARHAVTLSAAYSSDLGGSTTATWTDRDFLGNASQLALSASVIDAGCTVCNGLGYDLGAQLTKPDFLRNDQSLQMGLEALKQYLLAYDQIEAIARTNLTRKLSSFWAVSVGATLEQEQVLQDQYACNTTSQPGIQPKLAPDETPWCHYTLLGIPVSGRYDSTGLTDPLAEPAHGTRLSLSVTPTRSFFGPVHPTFTILQAVVSHYFDFERLGWSAPGQSVLALRATGAEAVGATQFSLPPDQRLYAGGSATVRGFAYQSIGPEFPDGNPTGGTALAAGTVELRHHLFGNYGLAAFADAGEVTAGAVPFRAPPKNERFAYCTKRGVAVSPSPPAVSIGYGVGLRYLTPVGPLRFDIAAPGNPEACDAPFEVYIGLGEAF